MPSSRTVTNRNRKIRDAGLRRVTQMTRWSLAGALTGTGLFAGLAAHVGHGTASASTTKPSGPAAAVTRTSAPRATSTTSTPRSSGTSSAGTSAPSTAATTTPTTQAPYVAPYQPVQSNPSNPSSGGGFAVTSGAS